MTPPTGKIKNRAALVAHGDREGRGLALDILEGGLAAADPYENTRKLIRIDGNRLLVGGNPGVDVSGYGDEELDLGSIHDIYVLGAGKAVQRQALALEELLGERLTAGAITVKRGEGHQLRRIEVTEGAHPVPDDLSASGARKILALAKRAGPRDLVFTLFSDGASSLFALPADGLTLDDVRAVFFLGIRYGSQQLIHQVMPYLSAVNCGRILAALQPARSINLIMQVGRFPRWHGKMPDTGSWVPSWPPPRRPMAEAVRDLRDALWWSELTPAVRAVFDREDQRYDVPDLAPFAAWRSSFYQPIDPLQMVEGARARAEELGLRGVILSCDLRASSAAAQNVLAHVAAECEEFGRPFEPPVALITGGHLDVPVGSSTGIGGRNQEFVLLWARALAEGRLASKNVVVAAMDSDGTDGPGAQLHGTGDVQCMAGGVIDGSTMGKARELDLDVAAELSNHNSTMALMRLDSAIYTGNTGACLGDLRVAIVRRRGAPGG